ncbi:MAG: PEP-CTERM sorting domain-containing protein [Desulfobacterales bacterium]|jgi:hypothetical protein|nr:PEP-CTERM sorting domain-containing protein [Desulfobacterales bacterium]
MKTIRVCAAVFLALLVLCGPGLADTLTFSLDIAYDGSPPKGGPPWLTARFDALGDNQVKLTLDSTGLLPGELVGSWFFNFDPTLSFLVPVGGSDPAADITIGQDNQAAGTAKGFDIRLLFKEGFPAAKTAEYLFMLLDSDKTLLASSFDYVNSDGSYFSAAEVTNLTLVVSGWIADDRDKGPGPAPVSEPATMFLLGFGAFGVALFGKNRFKK